MIFHESPASDPAPRLAAVHARARTDVHQIIRFADRVFVVLDDDDRIAEIAQILERLDELRVVALVQADRRLVQYIERAHQARADLRREPDALGLAAGERPRFAVERQIFQADVHHEFQSAFNLAERRFGNLFQRCRLEFQRRKNACASSIESAVTVLMFLSSIRTFKLSSRKPLADAHRTDLFGPDILRAQAVAFRTRAVRAVEREQARLDLRERESVVRAGELCRERNFLVGDDRDDAVAVFEPRFDRFRQAAGDYLFL